MRARVRGTHTHRGSTGLSLRLEGLATAPLKAGPGPGRAPRCPTAQPRRLCASGPCGRAPRGDCPWGGCRGGRSLPPSPQGPPARVSALHICGKEGRSPHSAGAEILSEPSAFISLKSQETDTRTAVRERTHTLHRAGAPTVGKTYSIHQQIQHFTYIH